MEERATEYADLFGWWAVVITAGIVFIIIVSTYVYTSSEWRDEKKGRLSTKAYSVGVDFIFVWVLLSLLVLYVLSIGGSSIFLFAFGNIAVEVALLVYILKNSTKEA